MLVPTVLDRSWLNGLSRNTRTVLLGAVQAHLATDQLQDYRAYPKQLEFHAAGAAYRNRLLIAGNQVGKTIGCGSEMAFHLTGEYPSWWTGKRFDRPIVGWASGLTADATRDNPQRVLLGKPKQLGTGMIPKRLLSSIYGKARGTADLYDYYMVRHVSGGLSMLRFRYYAQDREAWQGPPVDVVWFDEEPPEDIYSEGLARTIGVRGITMMSFTPLKGYTKVVKMYLQDPDPEHSGRCLIRMTLYDAEHLTEEQVEAEIARWPKHEQRARIMGEPALGEGMIYPYDEDDIAIAPFDIPAHWPVLAGIDFGGASQNSHPTAAVKLAWDRDNDIVYVTRIYRRVGFKPYENWSYLRHWGQNLKWAWPRDGMNEEKGTGSRIIEMYRSDGMKALPVYAQYKADGRKTRGGAGNIAQMSVVSVERGLLDIGSRIEAGKFRVFANCDLWFEEMRTYHREDHKVVKIDDDLMDATRYGIMMLRFAAPPAPLNFSRDETADWELGF